MSCSILTGDVFAMLATLPADSIDCVVTSPPYWGLRDYGVDGQIGLEPTLGAHLDVMTNVFRAVRRVMKPAATLWLNYGDCYATKPNGRSAADTKAAGNDDRTFRDKPFSTVGGVLKAKDLCLLPERLAIALQEEGWWVRAKNIWGKPNPMPDSSGKYRPSTAHEMVWLLTKSARSFYDAEAVAMPCSENTRARVAQDVASQAASLRAHGGTKTNGAMKAVLRKGPPVAGWTTGDASAHTPAAHNTREARTRRAETLAAPRPPGSSPHVDRGKRGRYAHAPGVTPKSALASPGSKSNPGFHSATVGAVETRYLRNYERAPLQVWEIPTHAFSDAHFATFPPELAQRCVLAGCPVGGVVLDPFGGSGTVGLVADALGRDSILIELNPDYVAIAARRLRSGLVRVEGGDSRRGLTPLPLLDGDAP